MRDGVLDEPKAVDTIARSRSTAEQIPDASCLALAQQALEKGPASEVAQ